jgi:hypothetical protein
LFKFGRAFPLRRAFLLFSDQTKTVVDFWKYVGCVNLDAIQAMYVHMYYSEAVFPFFPHPQNRESRCLGCQLVCFQTQNPNLGKFWRALDWKMFIYCTYGHYGIFYGDLGNFMTIWYLHFLYILYIFPVLVSCTKKNLATLAIVRAIKTWGATTSLVCFMNSNFVFHVLWST